MDLTRVGVYGWSGGGPMTLSLRFRYAKGDGDGPPISAAEGLQGNRLMAPPAWRAGSDPVHPDPPRHSFLEEHPPPGPR